MDPLVLAVRALDLLIAVVRFARWTPTRASRAEADGFSVGTLRKIDWAFAQNLLMRRLAEQQACGCPAWRGYFSAFDIDCPQHDPLGQD